MVLRHFSIYWIATLLLAASACSSSGSAPQTVSEIAGVYSDSREGAYAATGITLDPNGTFVYSHWSCTISRRTTGEWRIVAPNLILANSFVHQEPSPLESWLDRSSNTISVTVIDLEGLRLPGAKITVKCQNGRVQQGVLGQDGACLFEQCKVVHLSADLVGLQDAEARPRDRNHNVFTMTLRLHPWFHIYDQLWYVDDGQLFQLSRPPLTKIRK